MGKLKKVKIRKSIDTAEKFIKRACAYMGEEANQIRFKDGKYQFLFVEAHLTPNTKEIVFKNEKLISEFTQDNQCLEYYKINKPIKK